ncbi:bidirectional sugar transporter N3-like [Mercurialis annua]|uniref:bidirectional sugar transporter N3-like n=1 Tax=Mercurialis annua TaxID=3986 RepID=UPI002160A18B|nr:bidirectional sugar transporter N3-like [Mercurialis annua]
MALNDPRFVLAFGILGNVVSFLVYLAPLPTFYRVIKKKSTEGFQSIPYSVALFSAMLTLYYATLKENAILLITINSIGCLIEGIYVTIFLIYATQSAKKLTVKLLVFFNLGAYLLIVLLTAKLSHGSVRAHIVGWICAVFSVCVFAAPLSIMRLVIRTRSVEYMPFSLSFFLTLCATCWLGYGLAVNDYFIASPNILGFLFGIAQMALYMIYKNKNKEQILPTTNSQELAKIEPQKSKDGLQNSNATNLNPKQEQKAAVLDGGAAAATGLNNA